MWKQVDDSLQLLLLADRNLDGNAALRELRLEACERRVEVGALSVEHVHAENAGDPEPFAPLPEAGRLHLDPGDCRDDHDRTLDDVERSERVGLESRVARRVDQVDLPALPFEMAEGRGERHLAPLLLLFPVGDRRARTRPTRGG